MDNGLVLWESLAKIVASQGAAPLVTWYDGPSRIELSARTLANGIAKAANLLDDEMGVGVGTPVAIRLGAHWQSVVWQSAALVCGATLADPAAGHWTIAPGPCVPGERLAVVGRDPFGMADREVPLGSLNAADLARAMPDALLVVPAVGDVAVVTPTSQIHYDGLATLAAQAAGPSGGRVAVVGEGDVWTRALWHCLVPTLTGTPVILSADRRADVDAQERITRVVDLDAAME